MVLEGKLRLCFVGLPAAGAVSLQALVQFPAPFLFDGCAQGKIAMRGGRGFRGAGLFGMITKVAGARP